MLYTHSLNNQIESNCFTLWYHIFTFNDIINCILKYKLFLNFDKIKIVFIIIIKCYLIVTNNFPRVI